MNQSEGGFSGWHLSEILESFIIEWVSDSMYRRRTQLSGGERGNGFEMWRLLYAEFQGGSSAVTLGGTRRLQEWPRCNRLEALSAHLDDWVDCLQTHCIELLHAPGILRTMLLGIIPTEFEDELLTKPHVKTWQEIVQWCKIRTVYKRQKVLAEAARKPLAARVNKLKSSEDIEFDVTPIIAEEESAVASTSSNNAPAWFQDFVNKIGDKPRAPKPGATKKREDTRVRKPVRIVFKGCWHCGVEGHSRAKCTEFNKLMETHNKGKGDRSKWSLPAGYKGKYEIAKAKAKAQKRVNQLDSGAESDANTEGDEWEDSDSDIMGANFGQTARALRSMGSMPILMDDPETDDEQFLCGPCVEEPVEDICDAFKGWAHKVSTKTKKIHSSIVSTIPELERLLKCDSKIAKIAKTASKKTLKSHLPNIHLEADEMVVLVDSGSTINAAFIAEHFPTYADQVIPSRAQTLGEIATTAGGHELKNEGRVRVEATVNGESFPIPFQNMQVDVPILSVRKYVRNGWKFGFDEEGGYMKNKLNSKTFKFIEADGAYWIKMKIQTPDSSLLPVPGFIRPGNP